MEELPDNQDAAAELHHVLPMKLNSHSVNPVLDVLKKIDHHKTAVKFLDQQIRERHQVLLQDSVMRYQTAADLVADRATASSQIKQRTEECLRLVKVRNVSDGSPRAVEEWLVTVCCWCWQKFIRDVADLKAQLTEAIANMIDYEVG